MKKWIFGFLLIGMLFVSVYIIFLSGMKNPIKPNNVLFSIGKNEKVDYKEQEGEDSMRKASTDQIFPCEQNTRNIGESFEMDLDSVPVWNGIRITINSIDITKDAVNTDARYYIDDQEVEFTQEGEIINQFSYVVANISIENTENTEKEIWMNKFKYAVVDKQTQDMFLPENAITCGSVLGYKTTEDTYVLDKSYFKYQIDGNEIFNCNLVMIIDDETLNKNQSFLEFNPSGTLPDYDVVYIKF